MPEKEAEVQKKPIAGESFPGTDKREVMIRTLEEEFRRGVSEIMSTRVQGGSREEEIRAKLYMKREGAERWEEARKRVIGNRTVVKDIPKEVEAWGIEGGLRIDLKEPVDYFNFFDNTLLTFTSGGKIKVFSVGRKFELEKKWESHDGLFIFLLRGGLLEGRVLDALAILFIVLVNKSPSEAEFLFQEFLLFIQPLSLKKIWFSNKFVMMKSHHGDMHLFDESLREVPLGISREAIVSSVLASCTPPETGLQRNRALRKRHILRLKSMDITVTRTGVEIVHKKKDLYETVKFPQIEQFVYTEGVLFLKDRSRLNLICFK
jgi:hypothetical protein